MNRNEMQDEDILPYIKKYIMEKKRVKYLAVEVKNKDLFSLKDESQLEPSHESTIPRKFEIRKLPDTQNWKKSEEIRKHKLLLMIGGIWDLKLELSAGYGLCPLWPGPCYGSLPLKDAKNHNNLPINNDS
ncbi:hypothetical protein RhiirA1_402142 [Rhizophagus irregularis]|uniref:Uncharacterized protein n=1 Tax=Rhizophagus irregularis TaxID=588596 RepID=A0A2N0QZL0_9GLOM|nr:hypothetical protein RhiirA1_402142 [Rhizophagus irregularis]